MMMNLNDRPKTLGQNLAYYSTCLVLAASCCFHSGILGEVMTAVAAVIVLAVAGLMLSRRGSCGS
jgi:hypothetical protein